MDTWPLGAGAGAGAGDGRHRIWAGPCCNTGMSTKAERRDLVNRKAKPIKIDGQYVEADVRQDKRRRKSGKSPSRRSAGRKVES